MGVHVLSSITRLTQRDMRPSAARSVEVACHSMRVFALISAYNQNKPRVSPEETQSFTDESN